MFVVTELTILSERSAFYGASQFIVLSGLIVKRSLKLPQVTRCRPDLEIMTAVF